MTISLDFNFINKLLRYIILCKIVFYIRNIAKFLTVFFTFSKLKYFCNYNIFI